MYDVHRYGDIACGDGPPPTNWRPSAQSGVTSHRDREDSWGAKTERVDLTSPQVTDMKNTRYTSRRYQGCVDTFPATQDSDSDSGPEKSTPTSTLVQIPAPTQTPCPDSDRDIFCYELIDGTWNESTRD